MFEIGTITPKPKVYTISQLNKEARFLLEGNFPLVWVEGEISNLAQPSSGHIYFSLKDEFAQVRCAMFRVKNHSLNFTPENGGRVLAQAQISIYEQRGDYQLIVHNMELTGDGVLRKKFEELKKKLFNEGLFNSERKRAIPKLPKCIGVVTSPTGAAIRDIISILKRRFASIPVIIYPTQVQGNQAAEQIVRAIDLANQHNKCDVLIVARGGGSLEDLWPFNEEIVARSIFASRTPIISGVGHEIDFTIADFVADQRAATPSAAAELVSPDITEWLNTVKHLQTKFIHLVQTSLHQAKLTLANLIKRLQHPGRRLQDYAQLLDNFEQRVNLAVNNLLKHKHSEIVNLSRALHSVSPLATLNRGYAIVTQDENDKILRSTQDVNVGNNITARLGHGSLKCIVREIDNESHKYI
ncbi:MAG: exodeoxyribonuclease VII large subunit [Coxiella sp. DG_40]|nr:MAG: exodeoxyribonuclease VII large subunit [Coxiella sp. DG_40]